MSMGTCTSEVATAIGVAVGVIILVECLITAPIIAIVATLCWRRYETTASRVKVGAYTYTYPNSRKSSEKSHMTVSEGGGGGVYEDPDKLASSGKGNYELTQCPAYDSIHHHCSVIAYYNSTLRPTNSPTA